MFLRVESEMWKMHLAQIGARPTIFSSWSCRGEALFYIASYYCNYTDLLLDSCTAAYVSYVDWSPYAVETSAMESVFYEHKSYKRPEKVKTMLAAYVATILSPVLYKR